MDLKHLPLWATLLLALGLVTRLTRIVVWDSITQGFRDKLVRASLEGVTANEDGSVNRTLKHKVAGFLAELTSCPWCFSVWVAAAVTPSAYLWSDQTWWNLVALAASLSYVASWVLVHESSE